MSFQYSNNDLRGKPILKKIDGEWVCSYQYYTTTEFVEKALLWCAAMNSPFRSLYK